MKTKITLLLVLLLATACTSAPEATTQSTPTSAPVASPEAALVDAKCPVNAAQADLAAQLPRVYSGERCNLHFAPGNNAALIGVTLTYPEGWSISLVNPDGTALLFELGGRVLFFQAYRSDLPLEQADQVTFSFEGSPPEGAVNPEEVVKDRIVQTLGDKQVLILTTALSDQTVRRYFLARSDANGGMNTLYMFQLTLMTPNLDNTGLITLVEEMIISLAFDR